MLTLADILSGPTPSAAGRGIQIDYTGSTPIYLITEDTSSSQVFGYGYLPGSYHEDGERWYHFLPTTVGDDTAVELLLPFELDISASHSAIRLASLQHDSNAALFLLPQQQQTRSVGCRFYWISEHPILSVQGQVYYSVVNNVDRVVGTWLDSLPDTMKEKASQERKRLGLTIDVGTTDCGETSYYQGFHWRRFLGYAWANPYVFLCAEGDSTTADWQRRMERLISHETGHYISHILLGDEAYLRLENQDVGGHGIGQIHPNRAFLLDEYAYFSEYQFTGDHQIGLQGLQPTDPNKLYIIATGNPQDIDSPSVEGFGSLLLASLNRSASEVTDLYSHRGNLPAPVVGAREGDIWQVLIAPVPATDINQLRVNIEAWLGQRGEADKLPAIAQRVGWSYSVKGQLVDTDGKPIGDAKIQSVSIVGTMAYEGGAAESPTSADGTFVIKGAVFPGKSHLRVTVDNQACDIPIEIDWNLPTNQVVNLEKLVCGLPQATPTPTPTVTPTPTDVSAGDWVLETVLSLPEPGYWGNDCYSDFQVSVGDGAFASSYSWKDEGCTGEGGPYYSGSVQTVCSWTPPPSYLKVGSMLSLSAACQSTAQQSGGGRHSGGGGGMYLTLNPPADNLGGRYGWSSKFLGEVDAQRWSAEMPVSDAKSGSIEIPQGENGDVLVIVGSWGGPGGFGRVVYKYVYGASAPPPMRTVLPTATPLGPIAAIPSVTPTPAVTPSGTEEEFFVVRSYGVAYNGAIAPTTFVINEPWLVTFILTYHWNNGQGATPGTIGLQASDGAIYGPWQATNEPGQGGAPNVAWVVRPNIVIPPGTYTVLDSDPSTWAQNQETGGAGMAWGSGIRVR